MRRVSAALAVAVCAALCAAPASASPYLLVGPHGSSVRDDPALPPRADTDLPAPAGHATQPPPASAAKGPGVNGALSKALAKRTITRAQYDSYRALYARAKNVRARLGGTRRRELSSVISNLELIAGDGNLTGTRMPALFITLQRNVEFWPSRSIPAGGTRLRFKGDETFYQYYAGQGIEIQPWLTNLLANELWEACNGGIRTNPKAPCEPGRLRHVLDAQVAHVADRGNFKAWEYYFFFGGGRPPWTSGLSQGAGIQALARGATYLPNANPAYLPLAKQALKAYQQSPPYGIRVSYLGGYHYLNYSFDVPQKVMNTMVRSLISLWDYWHITGSTTARDLFIKGDRSARRELPLHDTGAWSLYNVRGPESDLSYHRVLRTFLRDLCERSSISTYCAYENRFTLYVEQHPRIHFLGVSGAGVGRQGAVRFRLSKISTVQLRVSKGGTVTHVARFLSPYGVHSFAWVPRRAGSYQIKLEATDYRNHHTVTYGRVAVG